MMENLAQIAQLMRGRNPQEVVMNMITSQHINDPTISQLVQLAQQGDQASFDNFAQALFRQQGLDLNQELEAFMSLMK